MLNKAVSLNMKMISNEIGGTVALSIAALLCTALSLSPAASILALVFAAATVIVALHGCITLFMKSMFGREAEVIMTLPVTPENMIIGKAITAAIWVIIMGIEMFAIVIVMMFMTSSGDVMRIVDSYIIPFVLNGMTPLEIGCVTGISMLFSLVESFVLSFSVMAVQLVIHRRGKSWSKSIIPAAAMIITMAAVGLINKLIQMLTQVLMDNGVRYTFLFAVDAIVTIGIAVLLYKFCVKKLKYGYDVEQ